jgi:3-phosphoshikimate 1-carboxyvinyltransferase
MARVITPLRAMGAKFEASDGGRPPLKIVGGRLKAINYKMPVASAQVKSAILFAGLFAGGETIVSEPIRTRDHGEQALVAFGALVKHGGNESRIAGGRKLRAIEAAIPGDISSAAFFVCAAALFPESQLVINDLLLNPTRARLLDILIAMGVGISVTQLEEQHGELRGTVQVSGERLTGATISGADTASLIDEIPVLAGIAPYTANGIEIRDARELRLKESDRIAALATNLRAMGGRVEELEDGLKIPGSQELHGAEIDSFGDHRIAMAFATAALRAEGTTKIRRADAAVISYPGFFEALENLVQR